MLLLLQTPIESVNELEAHFNLLTAQDAVVFFASNAQWLETKSPAKQFSINTQHSTIGWPQLIELTCQHEVIHTW